MSWAGLGSNDFITGNNLQDAVNTGVFSLKSGHSITANNTFLTVSEINAKVNVDTIGGTGTSFAIKSQLVSAAAWHSYSFVRNVVPHPASTDYTKRMEVGMMAHFGSPCHNYTIYSQKVISSNPFGVGDVMYKDSSGTVADVGYYSRINSSGTADIYFFNGSTITEATYADQSEYTQLGKIQLAEWIGDAYYSHPDFPVCYTIGSPSVGSQVYSKNVTSGCIGKLSTDYDAAHGVIYPFFVRNDGGYGGRGTPYRVTMDGIIQPMITLDFTQFFEFPWAESSGFDVAVNAEYIVRATPGTSYTNTFLNDVYNNLYAIDKYGNEISIGNNYFENINNSTSKVKGGTTVFYGEESVMPVVLMSPSAMDIYPSIKSGILIAYYNREVG